MNTTFIKQTDTVRCYRQSSVDIAVQHRQCKIEYIDGGNKLSYTKSLMRLKLISDNIPQYLRDKITGIYNNPPEEFTFTMSNPGKLINVPLSNDMINMLGIGSVKVPDNYVEKSKFKFLLDYFTRVSVLNGTGLNSKILKCRSTFNVMILRTIYYDGVSRMYELEYQDNKFESLRARYIIALTGDNVRWICFNNMYTNTIVDAKKSVNLDGLVDLISPGDSIADFAYICGQKYEDIVVTLNMRNPNSGVTEPTQVSLFDAIYNAAIVVKLEDVNKFWMLLPNNDKFIACTSSGTGSYSSRIGQLDRGCTINSIEDYSTSSTLNNIKVGAYSNHLLFTTLMSMSDKQIEDRIQEYKEIGYETISPYQEIRDYCIQNNLRKIGDLTSKQLLYLMQLPVVESKSIQWYNKLFKEKTITPQANDIIQLKDGCEVRLNVTRRVVKMTNPLLTGGTRKVYTYEINDKRGRMKVYAGMMPLQNILDYILEEEDNVSNKEVYKNVDKFDIVPMNDLYFISSLFTPTHESYELNGKANYSRENIWLAVHKATGVYYIVYINLANQDTKMNKAVILVRIGSMDVFLDYAKCAISYSASGAEILKSAAITAIYGNDGSNRDYNMLLKARELCIKGEKSADKYFKTGLPHVLCNLFGVELKNRTKVLKELDISNAIYEDSDDDSDNIDFGDISEIEIADDEDIEITDDDIGDIEITDEDLGDIEDNEGSGNSSIEDTEIADEDGIGDIEITDEDIGDIDDIEIADNTSNTPNTSNIPSMPSITNNTPSTSSMAEATDLDQFEDLKIEEDSEDESYNDDLDLSDIDLEGFDEIDIDL